MVRAGSVTAGTGTRALMVIRSYREMEFSTAPSVLGSIHLSWFSGRPSLAGPSTTLVIQPSSVDSGQVSTAGLNFTVPQVSTAGLNFTVHQVSITAVLRME